MTWAADTRGARIALIARIVALGSIFGLLAVAVLVGDPLQGWDRSLHGWVTDHRSGFATDALKAATALGGGLLATAVVLVIAGGLLLFRRWVLAAYLSLASSGTAIAVAVLKRVIDRPRPPMVGRLVDAGGGSFPSGHSARTLALWFALAFVVTQLVDAVWVRRVAFAIAIGVTVMVGVSRVYLGVHWASDVAGAWLLATTWLLVLTAIFERVQPRRPASGTAETVERPV